MKVVNPVNVRRVVHVVKGVNVPVNLVNVDLVRTVNAAPVAKMGVRAARVVSAPVRTVDVAKETLVGKTAAAAVASPNPGSSIIRKIHSRLLRAIGCVLF